MMQDPDPLSRAMSWLERPAADWPVLAAGLYADAARLRVPARSLLIEGRAAVLAYLREDAARHDARPPLVLRRVIAGERLIDETVVDLPCPAEGIAGMAGIPAVAATPGQRVELKRTRVISFVGGLIVDELHLETWSLL